MSPLRWEVLGLAFVLALPVLALGLRGDLTLEDVVARLPWCLAAAWAAVALLTSVTRPRQEAHRPARDPEPSAPLDTEPTPAP
ncbi:hypothetical protein [Trujillonella humicola]|uniref:hypothetical protein n=1 Tax=Trujillonella humicola TaxID=3383699 RepID=UPI003905C87A